MNAVAAPSRSPIRAVATRLWAISRPSIDRLVYANGGLGDELMLTAVARTARLARRPIHVLTDLPDLWQGNQDVASVQHGIDRWHYARLRRWVRTDIKHLAYETKRAGRHIAQQMADHLQLELPPGWRPIVPSFPTDVPRQPRRIVVQNSCRGARYAAPTKEWSQEQWRRLVALLSDFEIIQLGTQRDPALEGVLDRRGSTSLHQAAGLIASAACFVGLESGLMHVAAAVGAPAVIIYGGRTSPRQTGYPFQHHVTREPDCAGCALNEGCPHAMVCMNIPAEEVHQAVRAVLSHG